MLLAGDIKWSQLDELLGARAFEPLTSASGVLFVCRQGYILFWHGAIREMKSGKMCIIGV